MLERHAAEAGSILFLCSGNILRSAFAELLARHLGCPLPVRSAATVYRNERIHPAAAQALADRGVPPEEVRAFRSTFLGDAERTLDADTLVIGMTKEHLDALGRPELRARAHLLRRAEGLDSEIDDPLFSGRFEESFTVLTRAVRRLVDGLEGVRMGS